GREQTRSQKELQPIDETERWALGPATKDVELMTKHGVLDDQLRRERTTSPTTAANSSADEHGARDDHARATVCRAHAGIRSIEKVLIPRWTTETSAGRASGSQPLSHRIPRDEQGSQDGHVRRNNLSKRHQHL